MTNFEQNDDKAFIIEKIKERPVNKKKLMQRTLLTAAMAVMFGLIACLTFLLLEPIITKVLYPEEQPQIVVFPEDQDEVTPEEMLSESKQESSEAAESTQESLHADVTTEMIENMLSKEGYLQIYGALSDYVEELGRSMVTVTGIHSDVDWFNEVQTSRYQSSGVVIANNGLELLILTNYEPLAEADSISLSFYSGRQQEAILKSFDEISGLAIVAVELSAFAQEPEVLEEEIVIARLGSSNLKSFVGTPVVALGNPIGLSDSIGYGMITAQNTQQSTVDRNYSFWSTDIQGNENSDGILFNLQGQVIGVITDDVEGSAYKNMVTAYGITELKKTIEKLSNTEDIAYLGIHAMDVSTEAHEEMQVPYGAYVKRVELDSPAMTGGMQIGDIITDINGKTIMTRHNYASTLLELKPGESADITIMRQSQNGYKEIKLSVVPTKVD